MRSLSELVGKTIVSVDGAEKGSERIAFHLDDGRTFVMYHSQDCCESVDVEDVCGDVADLIGSPVVRAEEPSSLDDHDGTLNPGGDSFTWTYYIIGTAKGTVTIRWYGSSNGYYGETPYCEWEASS